MKCTHLPTYCVHQSTPVRYFQQVPQIIVEKPIKLESEVDGINRESFLNGPGESERVKEIQKKIDSLWECNDLLINHIRKLFDSPYRPTQEDLEYLQQLYATDQQNVQELGESLSRCKLSSNSSSSLTNSYEIQNGSVQTGHAKCVNPCIRQWKEFDYSAIKSPSPLPLQTCGRKYSTFYQQQKPSLQKKYSLKDQEDKCCRRMLGECVHNKDDELIGNDNDLLRMETELKELEKRVEKYTEKIPPPPDQQIERSDWSVISVTEEDKNKKTSISCKSGKCKKSGKCTCEKNGKIGKRIRCIIT